MHNRDKKAFNKSFALYKDRGESVMALGSHPISGKLVATNPDVRNQNVLVVGLPGSGKTPLVCQQLDVTLGAARNVFVLDADEKLYRTYKDCYECAGYKVFCVDTQTGEGVNALGLEHSFMRNGAFDAKEFLRITGLFADIFSERSADIPSEDGAFGSAVRMMFLHELWQSLKDARPFSYASIAAEMKKYKIGQIKQELMPDPVFEHKSDPNITKSALSYYEDYIRHDPLGLHYQSLGICMTTLARYFHDSRQDEANSILDALADNRKVAIFFSPASGRRSVETENINGYLASLCISSVSDFTNNERGADFLFDGAERICDSGNTIARTLQKRNRAHFHVMLLTSEIGSLEPIFGEYASKIENSFGYLLILDDSSKSTQDAVLQQLHHPCRILFSADSSKAKDAVHLKKHTEKMAVVFARRESTFLPIKPI